MDDRIPAKLMKSISAGQKGIGEVKSKKSGNQMGEDILAEILHIRFWGFVLTPGHHP